MSEEILKNIFSAPESPPIFKAGQKVRVISRIDVNMPTELSYWLNSICRVMRVIPRGFISREWCYELEHKNGARCEFKSEELDFRYRIRKQSIGD